ncbi:MAG: histidine--tRNA ligase [Legionellaceae bacterium]
MSDRIQAVRGMNDILPEETYGWRSLERAFDACMDRYGYHQIRLPLLESTGLFKRSIGEVTDIVEKEMYTFLDRNGESLTLRPEGTAGCVRACLEHGLLHHQVQKVWYCGPMFRYEKPQKGRYRQFTQLGVEVFGIAGVGIELELIAMCANLWKTLGLSDVIHLQLNTLGELAERERYRETLVAYFRSHVDALDEDSKRRLETNPLRILDSKNKAMQTLIAEAPRLFDALGEESQQHFNALCSGLDALGIAYTINPCLVRGLDYYEHTVFEWVSGALGSQSTVCAGGRFDRLIEHLGGDPTPAVGFAMGADRLLLLMNTVSSRTFVAPAPMVFIIAEGEGAVVQALCLAETLREQSPSWSIITNTSGGRFKHQFKKADKSGARVALVLGEDEVLNKTVCVKDLRASNEQKTVSQADVYNAVNEIFSQK